MALFNKTLLELRHMVSDRMNDMIVGVIDSAGSGTLVCTEYDWEKSDDYFNEWREVYCYAGNASSVGTSGKPTDWVNSSHQLTFAPAATLVAADSVEIHRRFSVREINAAINQAIDRVAMKDLQDRNDESTSLVNTTWVYDLPSTFVSVIDLYMSDANGVFMYQKPIDPMYWRFVKKSDGVDIEFIKEYFTPTNGATLRIVGQAAPGNLDTDSEQTPINPEYIVQRSLAILHQSRIRGNTEESQWHATQEGIAAAKARAFEAEMNTGIKGRPVVDH